MIKLSGDSTIDITEDIKKRYNISTKSLIVCLGDKEYIDGETITSDEILKYVDDTKQLPKTSAINEESYYEYFKELTKNGDSVIHFNISAEMSSCYSNALLASKRLKNVYVVDTRNLSTGSALLMLHANDLIKQGKMNAEEIAEECRKQVDNVHASFVIENLKLLYKGGRCSMVAMFGANILKLRPCIEVTSGKMTVRKKYRGKMEIIVKEYIKDMIEAFPNVDNSRCFVTYTTASDEMLKNAIDSAKELNIFKEVLVTRALGTVTSHCGHHTLGILFMTK